MAYDNIVGRADVEGVIPVEASEQIIAETPRDSVVLARARRVPMGSRESTVPILTAFPVAYWVQGDEGLKQTSDFALGSKTITAEELAVIVVIPDSVVEDAAVDLWGVARPLLVEALGAKVDQGVLSGGGGVPASWAQYADVIGQAVDAGNVVDYDPADFPASASALLGVLDTSEFIPTGIVSKSLIRGSGRLAAMNAQQAGFISPDNWFGVPVDYRNWGDPPDVIAVAGDWTKAVIGIRRDIRFEMFSEGVINDEEGRIVFNLLQQDLRAIRATFRVAFAVAVPKGASTPEDRFPFAVMRGPGGASGASTTRAAQASSEQSDAEAEQPRRARR
jgi:Phage capsid family